jgi:antitoxin PrlF
MKSIVSEKGQVTIPKKLREQLGLTAGATLEFREDKGKLVAQKRVAEDPFEKWVGRGKLPAGKSTDEYLQMIRGR